LITAIEILDRDSVVEKGSWKKTRSWKLVRCKVRHEIGKNENEKLVLKLERTTKVGK